LREGDRLTKRADDLGRDRADGSEDLDPTAGLRALPLEAHVELRRARDRCGPRAAYRKERQRNQGGTRAEQLASVHGRALSWGRGHLHFAACILA